jgi:predicted O-linked N-acetylglucosamine transferase (SPINDLY family)
VFCNLNRLSKADGASLACWLRVLRRVPQSVLWLLAAPSEGVAMVQRQVKEAGIDLAR